MAHTCNSTMSRRDAVVLLLSFASLQPAKASDSSFEREGLTAVLRQLDSVDRLAAQRERFPQHPEARYHFDYARLRGDVRRMQAGIIDYLTPERAQPRDSGELLGEYRIESAENP